MVDTLYPSRQKDEMSSQYLDDDWLTPMPTPYQTFSQSVDNTPTISLPPQSPTTNGSIGSHRQTSPVPLAQDVPDLIYPHSSPRGQGLGIMTSSSTYPSLQSTVSEASSSIHASSSQHEGGRGRSFTAPPMPMTPQTMFLPSSRLTPQNHFNQNLQQPVPIAPNPSGLQQMKNMKRLRTDDHYDIGNAAQRRRSASASTAGGRQTELSEEEQLLLKLKHEDNLPWKDIAKEFENQLGRSYQVPALQMRFKRLRERMRTWNEEDVHALEAAHEYWEKSKFEIIAQKMLDFGAAEKWPSKYCERKWEELHPGSLVGIDTVMPHQVPNAMAMTIPMPPIQPSQLNSHTPFASDNWLLTESTIHTEPEYRSPMPAYSASNTSPMPGSYASVNSPMPNSYSRQTSPMPGSGYGTTTSPMPYSRHQSPMA
ncbi:MAG: hypothetical protein Q9227_000051 [Pyrenula ochraceoflavens]